MNPDQTDIPLTSGQSLCKACGLCCRGVWFSHVNLEDNEIETAQKMGLLVNLSDGSSLASFNQPCTLHQGGCCSTYETWRPKNCAEYICALLKRFNEGEISGDEALSHVHDAIDIVDRLNKEMGHIAGGLKGKTFMSMLSQPTGNGLYERLALSPSAILDTVALDVCYKKHFKPSTLNYFDPDE